MSKYINVSTPKQTEWHKDKAIIKYTISRDPYAYFGMCYGNSYLIIKRSYGYYKYWGFPVKSKWRSEWGTPAYVLSAGQYTSAGAGYYQGELFESREFTDEIPIKRGNARQGSAEVTVGVYAGSNISSDFGTTLKTIRVYTSKVADASNVTLTVEVDSTTPSTRKLIVKGGFTNPENYYNMRLFKNGTQIKDFTGEYTEDIPVSASETINFELRIYGADGTYYKELTVPKSITIAPVGPGVSIKSNNNVVGVVEMNLKNVTLKNISEVWIKKDGKLYKTVK